MKLHPSNVRGQFLACSTLAQCDALRDSMNAELAAIPDAELCPAKERVAKARWIWAQTIKEQHGDRVAHL